MIDLPESGEHLYHYTTWNGALGILKSQSLWATHYRFFNDSSEIRLFREKYISLMIPRVRDRIYTLRNENSTIAQALSTIEDLDEHTRRMTELMIESQYRAVGDDIYIVSFCAASDDHYVNRNGLLSQWRGYGIDGGIVIVFNSAGLNKLLEDEKAWYQYNAAFIKPVVYSDDEKAFDSELAEDLSILADETPKMFAAKMTEDESIDLSKGYLPFCNCISRYKHRAFKEEREVRIIAFPMPFDNTRLEIARNFNYDLNLEKPTKFREQGETLVPYIELFDCTEATLPIDRIIVGPHPKKYQRATALELQLSKTNIEVTVSEIPLAG